MCTPNPFNNLMRSHDYRRDYSRQTMHATSLHTYHNRTDNFNNAPVQMSINERPIPRSPSYNGEYFDLLLIFVIVIICIILFIFDKCIRDF